MNDLQWTRVSQFIRQADHLLIASHLNPDGDALGSTLAVANICHQFGKKVTCVNESPLPEKFSFLPGIDEIQQPESLRSTFQHVIAVDAADQSRLGEKVLQLFDDDVFILNIDHHITNDQFGTVNIICPEACSTAEVIYQWVTELEEIQWNPSLATSLYTGLLTDTGGFRYQNTSADVLRKAAQLIDHGAPASLIAEQALETSTIEQLKILQRALATLQISSDGHVAWLEVRKKDFDETGATHEDLDGLVNMARNLVGVEVGILFYEKVPNEVKVSFRSRKRVDVAKIAKELGGGGHARAAGCTLYDGLSTVKQQVIKRVVSELGCDSL